MSDAFRKDRRKNKAGRALDFFVIFLCLSGVAVSLYMFQKDMFRTLRSMTIQPVGTVTVRHNTVQRRLADRVVWDRLFTESPVYPGDLIRIAKLSDAMLNIDNNYIELGENSLIRIQRDSGASQIDFFLGDISISSDKDGGSIMLTIAGRQIEAGAGTVLSAAVGDEGMVLRVNEGSARIMQDGQIQMADAGTVIAQDSQGRERLDPMAAVTLPRPNARYLKTGLQPVTVNFSWSRVNLEPRETLRLEIAEDRNFSRVRQAVDNLLSTTAVGLNAGLWYWRLTYKDSVLDTGRVTVTETSAPVLLNSAGGRRISYRVAMPEVLFQWTNVNEAVSYNLQVSQSPDFSNSLIFTQVQGTSYISNELSDGTWYWRVQPVYPSVYEGSAVSSNTGIINISQSMEPEPPVLNAPAADSIINIGNDRSELFFSWANSREAEMFTILISTNPELNNSIVHETTANNFFTYRMNENLLSAGRYYWGVSYTDIEGYASQFSQSRSFTLVETEVIQKLISPPDRYSVEEGRLPDTSFTWTTNLPYDRRFQVSALPDFSRLVVDEPVTADSYSGISIPAGDWYWRVSAKLDAQSSAYSTPARRFTVTMTPLLIVPEPEPPPPSPQPVIRRLTLVSPAQGAVLPGLTALRQPTVFRWETSENIGSSRFILSRNPNPQRQPEMEIQNPGRIITVNTLEEGLWYWTVEAQTRDGQPVTAGTPMQLRVQPVPLLPPPANMLPLSGHRIGVGELRRRRDIEFSWSAVRGANMYILTIIREASPGRQRIFQTEPLNTLNFTFNNLELFDNRASYVWQVEALFYNAQGRVEQRGAQGENQLIIDIPHPGPIQTEDTGVLYGF